MGAPRGIELTENLLYICSTAFLAVFVLLTILSLSMRLITRLFPPRSGKTDGALVAAVTVALQQSYPGTSLLSIEEEK